MTLSDLEWLSEIFSDMKHRAVSLPQLSVLYDDWLFIVYAWIDRQFRLLWFTYRREYHKCRETGGRDVSEAERKRRREYPYYSDYWDKLVDMEERTAAFLCAIATLIEDAGEITLQLYIIIGHGVQENIIGQFTYYIHYQNSADNYIQFCTTNTQHGADYGQQLRNDFQPTM